MPNMDGIEVCRRVRESLNSHPVYVILLTVRDRKADIVRGLEAGADDYIAKPFDEEELRVRVLVGVRIIELQRKLSQRVDELTYALQQVKQFTGLLPICSYCKRIRDDQNYWQQVESYISKHSEALFTHGVCPDCFGRVVRPQLAKPDLQKKGQP